MRPEFISSESNSRIKLIKALRDRKRIRQQERLFIVEGPRFILDALVFATPHLVVLSEAVIEEWGERIEGLPAIVVPDALFAAISGTVSNQGILAAFPIPDAHEQADVPALDIVADGIQDPGNLGTLIRSAASLGATRVLCARGTVDPWSPKAARAAAASLFQIPVLTGIELLRELNGRSVYVAEAGVARTIDQVDWTEPCALIVGGEGSGPVSDLTEIGPVPVSIPSVRPVESLNAGVAASIVLYEAARQRLRATVPGS